MATPNPPLTRPPFNAIRAFLERKWERELDYRLRKELWAFNRQPHLRPLRIRVARHRRQWSRSHGNKHWEFDKAGGLMRRRDASINDYPIAPSERRVALP